MSAPAYASFDNSFFDCISKKLRTDQVVIDQTVRAIYETATFPTASVVAGILFPENVAEVQQIVALAAQTKTILCPVSGGMNWGLGSRVPGESSSWVVDLSRMKVISEFSEDLSYMTVEPGVTFQMVSDFLAEKKSGLFLAMIGGPGAASLIGNAVERGDGVGPHGDRATQIAGFQVVLPNGEVIETGFGAFHAETLRPLSPHAPGPDLHGLFLQSSYGIVTRMTFWLRPKPAVFHGIAFSVAQGADLAPIIEGLRELQGHGIIHPNSFALWNLWKVLASQMQYPWDRTGGNVISEEALRKVLPPIWRDIQWCGYVALYSASPHHARVCASLVRKKLRGKVKGMLSINQYTDLFARIFSYPVRKLTGFDLNKFFGSFYRRPVALGIPMDMNVGSLYWRKKEKPRLPMDPHRDQCGLHWLCHTVPYTGAALQEVGTLLSTIFLKHGFEPNIAFLNTSPRTFRLFAVLTYDREVMSEDSKASACILECHESLLGAGCYPFRLGIHDKNNFWVPQEAYSTLLSRMKQMVDPSNILSPSRYRSY